jgi:biofilm PGA synthesis N-glycosyltransferase PgaC
VWTGFSIKLSIPWLYDLATVVTFPVALLVIIGIAYVPGYINVFMIVSLLLDKQPIRKAEHPAKSITIMTAAKNEAKSIRNTLKYIKSQDYDGHIRVIVIDNGSTDDTCDKAIRAGIEFELDLIVITEDKPGKYNALNSGLSRVDTELIITLDADTLLHKSAVRYLVARFFSSPQDVCAVAGSVLVRNSRTNIMTSIQEWDYFLGIASIKRLQGLYQGTLVAQGAFSLYRTKELVETGGWPDAIGEDIILTWELLQRGGRVYFEPLSVAFTEVPSTIQAFSRQRSRWARGMIEALKMIKPWVQPLVYTKYLTGVNLLMPYLDVCYAFFWIPGLILALIGIYWIVGLMTLLVLPLTLLCYGILFIYQQHVFKLLNLQVRRNLVGFFVFVLFYQLIMSPVSIWGYLEEFFRAKRKWK